MTTFSALGLCDALLRAIEAQGFETPTPIQAQAIPHLLEGRDVTGLAQTGGGKTAAFVLPMLQAISEEVLLYESCAPLAIILAPTRELAAQIGEHIRHLARFTQITHTVVTGGTGYREQIQKLQRGVHILVATPGRMQDHVRRGNIRFDNVRFFALDEADRMLDMGFVDEVKDVAKRLPERHQTILFSATMSKPIRALSESLQNNPARVYVERETSVANTIEHKVMHVLHESKHDLLLHLLQQDMAACTLIFTRTKRGADKLSKIIGRVGHKVDSLHGDKPQHRRQKILKAFKNGKTKVLVATDVAARGIDVKGISLVVNFDLPLESENYVHRVGRTGRAGEAGLAVSFCSPGDIRQLKGIEGMLKASIDVDSDHEWHVEPKNAKAKAKASKKEFGPRGRRHGGFKNGGFKGKTPPWKRKKAAQAPANDGGELKIVKPRTDNSAVQKPGREEFSKKKRFGGHSKPNGEKARFNGGKAKFNAGQGKAAKRRSNAASGRKSGYKSGGNKPAFRRAS